MIDGIINVYKEQGYTSFDVVARLRGILRQKKIGHTGTLDPLAEGVLMVCLGKATKLVDMLTSGTKQYNTVMKLGTTTDTEDITGKVLSESDNWSGLTSKHIIDTIKGFVGEYDQIPPMYSAIKKNGKKLYEYARQGAIIDREARHVEIFSIDNISVKLPYVSFDVHCSKGTYIRSLCRDIGNELMCGACMTALVRSDVHGYKLEDALRLSYIEKLYQEGILSEYIIPIDKLLDSYKLTHIRDNGLKLLMNGNKLSSDLFIEQSEYTENEIIRVYADKEFIGLYQYSINDKIFKPYKMFLN